MANVEAAQMAKIPFIDHAGAAGRSVYSPIFYYGTWRAWIEGGGQLIETRMWPAEAMYFGAFAEQETDIYLSFLNLMAQRLNYLPIRRQLFGLQDDIFNLSASLAKIQLMHRTRKDQTHGVSRMVTTEVEYLCGVCRSIFDLWQEVIVALWDSIQPDNVGVKKKQLKNTYREMLMSDNKLRTAEEMIQKFPGLPRPLVDCYLRSGSFFEDLREFRDRIVHRGGNMDPIFDGEEDFFISETRVRFREMNIWEDKDRSPNGLVSLTPTLGFVIYRTLETCDHFSQTIEQIFQLPSPLVPNFYILLRGYFNDTLVRALADIRQRITRE